MAYPETYTPVLGSYEDFGAKTKRDGTPNRKARTRPHCDMCGPFCGRYARRIAVDEFGAVYRCKGCDDE